MTTKGMREGGPNERPKVVIAKVPDQPAIRASLRDFGVRSQVLDQRHDELLQKYPDQWVALTSNWTLVAADTVEELAQSLDKKGLRRNDVAYRFMATNRRPMILLKKVARLVAVDDEIDRLRFAVDLA